MVYNILVIKTFLNKLKNLRGVKIFSIFLLIFLLGTYVKIFALGPGPFTPGVELDPECAPGSTDCFVEFNSFSLSLHNLTYIIDLIDYYFVVVVT